MPIMMVVWLPGAHRNPATRQRKSYAFGGTAQPLVPLQSFFPPWPWPLQAFLPAQSCLYSFDAQPPLPLQEFLPAQPLSPALQLPWDLHELRPLQACLSTVLFASVATAMRPDVMLLFDD